MRQIAIYGKGGIGKSTVAANLSACWAERGETVLQVGCSPKADSTSFLRGGVLADRTVNDQLRQGRGKPTEELLRPALLAGYRGILCLECGGPLPGTGCAGRGVLAALEAMTELRLPEKLGVTLVLYDVIGDVVCGGFAQPIRAGFAREIYLVSSGELMSLYAANNICLAVKLAIEEGGLAVRIGGIINNMRNLDGEEGLVAEFGRRIGVPVIAHLPRSGLIQEAESAGATLLQAFPDSPEAGLFRRLAGGILEAPQLSIPSPLGLEELLTLYREFAGRSDGDIRTPILQVREPAAVPKPPEAEGRKGSAPRTIALYGKGGIGKSTTASNLSAALSHQGERVLQVGCDPKHDSISTLCGRLMPTVLDELKERGTIPPARLIDLVHPGYNGVLGMECGGPLPGKGCAGRGVNTALQLLHQARIVERLGVTFALYDVLGDVVCGGFATPIKSGFVREVYVVTCGEILTLHMVNNILLSLLHLSEQGAPCQVAGLIDNQRGLQAEREIVEAYAELVGVPVIHHLPRSATVQAAELLTRTVIEAYPESEMAEEYRLLADKVLRNQETFLPRAVSLDQIRQVVERYGKGV